MRQLLICIICVLIYIQQSQATAVFVTPESSYPSGHWPQNYLLKKTKQIKLQRWLRVQNTSGQIGWVSEENLFSKLHLSDHAVLARDVPERAAPDLDARFDKMTSEEKIVQIVDHKGCWFLVNAQTAKNFWVLSENLKVAGGSKRLIVLPNTDLYMDLRLKQKHSRIKSKTDQVQLLQNYGEVAKIQWQGNNYFISKRQYLTASDLSVDQAVPIHDDTALYSAPLPTADVVSRLPAWLPLKVLTSSYLKWGQVTLNRKTYWWPIDNLFDQEKALIPAEDELRTKELFSRKIFDMASHPKLPELKWVSAGGIYHSMDGMNWKKLKDFHNTDYPIAFSKNGTLFIGPFASFDYGKNFQSYIKWDEVLLQIRRLHPNMAPKLKFVAITPNDDKGEHLSLKFEISKGLYAEIPWKMSFAKH